MTTVWWVCINIGTEWRPGSSPGQTYKDSGSYFSSFYACLTSFLSFAHVVKLKPSYRKSTILYNDDRFSFKMLTVKVVDRSIKPEYNASTWSWSASVWSLSQRQSWWKQTRPCAAGRSLSGWHSMKWRVCSSFLFTHRQCFLLRSSGPSVCFLCCLHEDGKERSLAAKWDHSRVLEFGVKPSSQVYTDRMSWTTQQFFVLIGRYSTLSPSLTHWVWRCDPFADRSASNFLSPSLHLGPSFLFALDCSPVSARKPLRSSVIVWVRRNWRA